MLQFSQRWGAAVRVPPTHLEEVPPLMHLLDVFICKDAARSLELAGALPGTSGDNRFMQAVGAERKRGTQNDRSGSAHWSVKEMLSPTED